MPWTGAGARGEREMCRTDQPGERQGEVSTMATAQAPPSKLHQCLPLFLSWVAGDHGRNHIILSPATT